MKYFSMFSGVGGFELGIGNKGECVGFSEIDKHASELLKKKFPNIKNYGDAKKINPNELPDFDLLCGGFPCQAFSIAGKRRGFKDTRGTMFFEIARILETKRPKNILLENVKGLLNHEKGQTFFVIIQTLSELGYGIQWMVLNSKFFGVPQNRERVFIIGSLTETSRSEILPFRESNQNINEEFNQEVPTSQSLRAGYYKGGQGTHIKIGTLRTHKDGKGFREMQQNICPTIPSRAREDGIGQPIVVIPILTPDRENKRQNGRRFKKDGDPSFTLTGQDIHGVMEFSSVAIRNKNRSKHQNKEGEKYGDYKKEYQIEEQKEGVSFTVKGATQEFMAREGMKIRRLTPRECEQLQGFPDGWTEGFSDTQRYKMMGNAVTVNVVEAIVNKL